MADRESQDDSAKRLASLAKLQTKLLSHALSFPSVKRVTYSTCSVHAEENEEVVAAVLEEPEVAQKFKLKKCLPRWEGRGDQKFSFADKVLRADPERDLCNGFFVALFQRRKVKAEEGDEDDNEEPTPKRNKQVSK